MDFTATKQQVFELSSFLKVQSVNFPIVSDRLKVHRVQETLEKAVSDYSKPIEQWAKDSQKITQDLQEGFNKWKATPVSKTKTKEVFPSESEQKEKLAEAQKILNEETTEIAKKAKEYADTDGGVQITVTLDNNDFSFCKQYFDKEATKNPMWQEGARLANISALMDQYAPVLA